MDDGERIVPFRLWESEWMEQAYRYVAAAEDGPARLARLARVLGDIERRMGEAGWSMDEG